VEAVLETAQMLEDSVAGRPAETAPDSTTDWAGHRAAAAPAERRVVVLVCWGKAATGLRRVAAADISAAVAVDSSPVYLAVEAADPVISDSGA
jgi:hypothetical protein